jgi:fructose-1,6-bisphosphatase-3
VYRLHIVGDIFDRGPRPDIILDELMRPIPWDVQGGNHDVQWMGAAAGSTVCVCSVIHVTLSYNNLETLEDGYGISLRPLSQYAEEVYRDTDVSGFWPKLVEEGEYTPADLHAPHDAQGHRRNAVQAGMRADRRNPDFGMQGRALLEQVDLCLRPS